MSTLFLVNDPSHLDPEKTTTALVRASAARGLTYVTGCTDLSASGTRVWARCRPVAEDGTVGPWQVLEHEDITHLLVRANPVSQTLPWAWAHALTCLARFEALGVDVRNSASGLARFAGKPGLLHLPQEVRPPTVLVGDAVAGRRAVEEFGKCVLKPAHGSQGRGVFILEKGEKNLGATLDLLLEAGPVIVQPWLAEAVDGDIRVFVENGELFRVKGRIAAIRRRPARGELRSNIHLGGSPEAVELPKPIQEVARIASRALAEQGVRFAGLDCIGAALVEVNVCAPGGLPDMGEAYGEDFVNAWLDRVVQP